MKTNSKFYLSLADYRPKGSRVTLEQLCFKVASETSLCPDTLDPQSIWISGLGEKKGITKPYDYICVILALSYCRIGWSSMFSYEKILNYMLGQAKLHNLEGDWKKVATLLSTTDLYTKGVNGVWSKALEDVSENDFYGNILPRVYNIIKNCFRTTSIYNQYDLCLPSTQKGHRAKTIKQKVYRRGYNDKGSKPPDDKWLPKIYQELVAEELERQEILNSYSIKSPPSRYWFKSLYPTGARTETITIHKSKFIEGESY